MLDSILTSIFLGLLATGSPCVFPLYPGFLAYLSGLSDRVSAENLTGGNPRPKYFLGVFVLAGVLTMMLALGLLIALLSVSVGSALAYIIPLADLLIVILGVLLLLNINPFKRLPQVQVPLLSHPYANAFVYGLLYGPIALPCSGPLVVSIFALSLTAQEVLSKLAIFFWFGVGFGLPLLLLSFLAGSTQRWITRQYALHSRAINVVSGLLLIGVAIYDVTQNWDVLLIYWAS